VVIEAANSTKDMMTILEKFGGREEEDGLKYPVLIGHELRHFGCLLSVQMVIGT
jgi:hypothetical protein